MAHAAIGYAKAMNRRQMMACTTSIGPGATNLVTACALAHVNRLPLLLLPGEVFANRGPDPVLQQLEDFGDPGISANDCLKPVSRYWDRITRAEQLLSSLPNAMRVLTDPAQCGPVTLALPQDVQTEAFGYPLSFFEPRVHRLRRQPPDEFELAQAVQLLRRASRPLIIAGGGVHYSSACDRLAEFAACHGIPVAETQAGKGALPWDHPQQMGGIGVTGSSAANELAADADLVLAIGTRLSDFTTGSRALLRSREICMITLNAGAFDAAKHGSTALVGDARTGLDALGAALHDWRVSPGWATHAENLATQWNDTVTRITAPGNAPLPSDAQVLGAVNRAAVADDVVVCAAGGLPGELHKLWRTPRTGGYHVEYGYSCMGYEIAGGLGVRMARNEGEVFVLVGDGSYLMLNSEIATSIMLGQKLTIVVLDNGGFGCINRLQVASGGASFNNLFGDGVTGGEQAPPIDFAAHAAALGALAETAANLEELQDALHRARNASRTCVIVINTDPIESTQAGGAWWDVPIAAHSTREAVRDARAMYIKKIQARQL
jgi:3D-(3,5/4)-trihydroxycyclohexane-1,2-dione acylhydrolase (decyclizing)